MPTYDYECPKCGHTFEKFQGINDPPVKTCPKCRGRKVKRLIGTGAGILFKGSGFYITDYRSKDYQQAARSEKGAASPSTGPASAARSETASPSKPEPAAKPAKPKESGGKPKGARGKSGGH